ncbi:putative zinc finger protein 575 [Trichinella spiralis]|uniref:putative zinc finger protein 575 n=1 Tax=Trichinella spiralis TaxID=6334 RepID=UPI0001EFCA5A|nr:putative zinc finger protein 575 [Trichinella spiralis]
MDAYDVIQFLTITKNQQKLVYRGRCYTLKRTNRNDNKQNCLNVQRYYYSNITSEPFLFQFRDREAAVAHCPQIWKPHNEHAESCPVNPHAFYHHQQLAELRRLASEDTRPFRHCRAFSNVGPGAAHNVQPSGPEIPTLTGNWAVSCSSCQTNNSKLRRAMLNILFADQ